ncbi:MAG: NAD-dependent epimerase/dehydratase family protein [Candidatus Aminicenantia bacterium]
MKVLLTGGTGFLGKNLLFSLLERGFNVRVLVRDKEKAEKLPEDVEKVIGDIRDRESLLKATKDVEGIFHLSALVKSWVRRVADYFEINVEGSRNIFEISRKRDIKTLYVSSFIVSGPTGDRIFVEEDFKERRKFFNHYERSKYFAYMVSRDYVRWGAPIITVFPGVIYGEGELTEGNIIIRNIVDHLNGNLLGLPGGGKSIWNFVHVKDCVNGMILAWEKGKIGENYILGGENAENRKAFEIIYSLEGINPPKFNIPYWLAWKVGALQYLYAEISGKPPKFVHRDVRIFMRNWAYSSKKAEKELGYKWKSLEEGIKISIEWLKEKGYGRFLRR